MDILRSGLDILERSGLREEHPAGAAPGRYRAAVGRKSNRERAAAVASDRPEHGICRLGAGEIIEADHEIPPVGAVSDPQGAAIGGECQIARMLEGIPILQSSQAVDLR